jgi:hypothetical protein
MMVTILVLIAKGFIALPYVLCISAILRYRDRPISWLIARTTGFLLVVRLLGVWLAYFGEKQNDVLGYLGGMVMLATTWPDLYILSFIVPRNASQQFAHLKISVLLCITSLLLAILLVKSVAWIQTTLTKKPE